MSSALVLFHFDSHMLNSQLSAIYSFVKVVILFIFSMNFYCIAQRSIANICLSFSFKYWIFIRKCMDLNFPYTNHILH